MLEPPGAFASGGFAMLRAMRSDRESIVIVVWVVLALAVGVAILLDAIGHGGWPVHLLVLVVAELVLAGLGRFALSRVR